MTSQSTVLQRVQTAAKAWARAHGAGQVHDSTETQSSEAMARAACRGEEPAISLLRAESAAWLAATPDAVMVELTSANEAQWLMPQDAGPTVREWLGTGTAQAHRELTRRASIRARLEACLRAPGVRPQLLMEPTGLWQPASNKRMVWHARGAKVARVAATLQVCLDSALVQPRVVGSMLARGTGLMLPAAQSATMRAAGHVPAAVHSGHHHAPHHYSATCRVCGHAWDDWVHASQCPALESDTTGPGLLHQALAATAHHFQWTGMLVLPLGAEESTASVEEGGWASWRCPRWAMPVARWSCDPSEPAGSEQVWRHTTRWASRAECAAAGSSGSTTDAAPSGTSSNANTGTWCVAGLPDGTATPTATWVATVRTAKPGMPLPRTASAGQEAAALDRLQHLGAQAWLAALCGWLGCTKVTVGARHRATVWSAEHGAVLDAPPWQDVYTHEPGMDPTGTGSVHIWWPSSAEQVRTAARPQQAGRLSTGGVWLVANQWRSHQASSVGHATLAHDGCLVRRVQPPMGWPLPWWPATGEGVQQLQQQQGGDGNSAGSDNAPRPVTPPPPTIGTAPLDMDWEIWWKPDMTGPSRPGRAPLSRAEAHWRAAQAARCHEARPTTEEERRRQLQDWLTWEPSLRVLALGRMPAVLARALQWNASATRATQARVTTWGMQVQSAAAVYWATRYKWLAAYEQAVWGTAGWLPGASVLRDMARTAYKLWGTPIRALDAVSAQLRAAVLARAAAMAEVAVFKPWPTEEVDAWWRMLTAHAPESTTLELAWLWLTPVALSTLAAAHASWGLTWRLAGMRGKLASQPAGASTAATAAAAATVTTTRTWNPLAWLAQACPHLGEKSQKAAAKWRACSKPGGPQQRRWWNSMVLAWGGPLELLAPVLGTTAATEMAHAQGWQDEESEENGSELDE